MKTCPKCEISTDKDIKVCTMCGTPFFPDHANIELEEKKLELKKLEKQMDRGGGLIAGGIAILIFGVIFGISILLLFIAALLLIIGFSMFGIPYHKSQKIKKEYPILIVSENKIKRKI